MATISTTGIVDGSVVYAAHVLRVIEALDGTSANTIIIDGDFQQGTGNSTDGSTSFAQGDGTDASGLYSHAEGDTTTSSGNYSHAEGFDTTASDLYSHAEGESTIASGQGSHAEGISTQAAGDNSHAEGESTVANGFASHAEGYYTIATADYQLAVGQYNKDSNTSDYFVVGVGSVGARADGLGVNATRTYISNSVYLPNLTNVAQNRVVTYSSSGQLYYAASESIIVTNAYTASFVTASNVYGPYGSNSILSASYAVSASQAQSSSYALSASYALSSSYVLSASYALSSSYSLSSSYAVNSSQAQSSSYALTASYALNGGGGGGVSIQKYTGTIPSQSFLSLYSNPYTLLPSSSGKFYNVISAMFDFTARWNVQPSGEFILATHPTVLQYPQYSQFWLAAFIAPTSFSATPYYTQVYPITQPNSNYAFGYPSSNSSGSSDLVLLQTSNDTGLPNEDVKYIVYYIEDSF